MIAQMGMIRVSKTIGRGGLVVTALAYKTGAAGSIL